MKRFAIACLALIVLASCGYTDRTPPATDNADKVAILVTGWGEPKGHDPVFRKQVRRAQTGAKRRYPFEPCTEKFAGHWPFASQVGLLPFAVAYPLPVLGGAYDSLGVYRLADNGEDYILLYDESIRLNKSEIPDVEGIIRPVSESRFAARNLNGIDPRDGTNYLADIYQIGAGSRERGPNPLAMPNGISDVAEIGLAGALGDARFMYEDLTPRVNAVDVLMVDTAEEVLTELFGNRIALKFGAYAQTPGVYDLEEDIAVNFLAQGFKKLILTRETTDNNDYANKFMTLGYVYHGLCKAGYADDVEIKQTHQVGRTPEYNTALLEILRPHLTDLSKDKDVAIIYTTYGMPFPGKKTAGPFGVANPLARDPYHENAYLNYQAFKRYAQDEFQDYKLQFNHAGKNGDKRTDSYYAYAMFTTDFYGAPDDPLRFPTIRENINAAKSDGRKEIVVLLSHWSYSNMDNMLAMRKMNLIPYNSREQMAQKIYWKQWCELPDAPQPVDCKTPGAIHLQFSEVFDKQAKEFGIGYGHRIRGTVERFGYLPEDVTIIAKAQVSAQHGGELAVSSGALKGTHLVVPADPQPGKPESFTFNDYEAFVDPSSPFIGAWFDFEAYIASPANAAQLASSDIVSAVTLVGPYRTIVNKPARLTLPFDVSKVPDAAALKPVIFNEVTQAWDTVYDVAGGQATTVTANAVSFDIQVFGLFALSIGPVSAENL